MRLISNGTRAVVLLALGARFFELFGYALAVLAFGILFAGVIWSLRTHVSEKRRTFFVAASFAVLITLCVGAFAALVLSNPLSLGIVDTGPLRLERELTDKGERDPLEGQYSISIDVQADGTVRVGEQFVDVERLARTLRSDYGDKRIRVTIRASAETTTGVIQAVIGQLQDGGIFEYEIQLPRDP